MSAKHSKEVNKEIKIETLTALFRGLWHSSVPLAFLHTSRRRLIQVNTLPWFHILVKTYIGKGESRSPMCSCARSRVGSCLLHRRSGVFSLFKLAIALVFFVRRFKMKYVVFALILAATAFVFSPASAVMMSCSGADMSK